MNASGLDPAEEVVAKPKLLHSTQWLFRKLTAAESIRMYACPLLVAQNSALFLVMKQSTSLHDDHYHTTVAVLMQEIIKFALSLTCILVSERAVAQPLSQLWALRREMLALLVPAVCYTGQNNLLYVGVAYLPAAVAQVLVQTKLLWAAIFSIALLGKRFSSEAWASFVVLVMGIVLVKNAKGAHDDGAASSTSIGGAMLGMAASVGAAGLSGFAGVYLEKTFTQGKASLLQMNVCLACISMPLQALAMLQFDRHGIARDGLFFGFHGDTWGVIGIQAAGGLLTAVVIKYTGNIMKGFATAIALLSTSLLSIPMLGFRPSAVFWAGLICVCAATAMYSASPITALLQRAASRRPARAKDTKGRARHGRFNRLRGDGSEPCAGTSLSLALASEAAAEDLDELEEASRAWPASHDERAISEGPSPPAPRLESQLSGDEPHGEAYDPLDMSR